MSAATTNQARQMWMEYRTLDTAWVCTVPHYSHTENKIQSKRALLATLEERTVRIWLILAF